MTVQGQLKKKKQSVRNIALTNTRARDYFGVELFIGRLKYR